MRPLAEQVVVLAPTSADADIAGSLLSQAGISSIAFASFDELCVAIEKGVGAAVLVEEALTRANLDRLTSIIDAQPPWSSTPILVLTRPPSNAREAGKPFGRLPGALLIERPVRIENLISAVRNSLDARRRQYAMRDLLEEAQRSAAERSQLLRLAEQSRQQAEGANRMKDEFLAVLSHELRTPLNAILGWAALLRRGSLNTEQIARAVESIERNSRLQARLIEDLLDMSRVISGSLRLDLQTVELDPLVAEAISTVTPASVAKGVTITPPGDGPRTLVRGDPARLQQIIWNLLSNAIRFTPRGGAISVSLERNAAEVALSVSDTGEGIAPEFLPHVFERFRQADSSTTRQRGGLGLGLAIVRQLVDMHGGSVQAASDGSGRGARFTVRLPAVSSPEHLGGLNRPHEAVQTDTADLDGRPLSGKTVLLVDDDPEALSVLSTALYGSGAIVHTAESAASGFELARRISPSVIVSDISMPGEDGFALIRKLRSIPATAGIPAIALTAHAREQDKAATSSAGFARHLPKPIDPAELVSTVAALTAETTCSVR